MKLSIEQKAFGGKIPGLLDIADAQVVAACDVDSWRLNKAKETIEAHYAKNTSSGKYKGCAIYQDFRDIINRKDIDAIKTNRKTLEPIETGHRTISISQIGLIACQIGEKLKWNPEKELFEGNNAANALLAAPLARKQWAM